MIGSGEAFDHILGNTAYLFSGKGYPTVLFDCGYQIPERSGATRVVSPRFVEDAHHAGLGVQVWTVDTGEDARRLLEWGVDALITDRPDVIVPLVAAW